MRPRFAPPGLAAEIAELAERYGPTAFVEAVIPDGVFDPLKRTDRVGEICMVIRRPSGRLLIFRKRTYPAGVMRLLTGGIAHGESVAAALAREVAEETSLDVAVRRMLAVIAYRTADTPPGSFVFYTCAFLLDELGGALAVQDLDEDVEQFDEAGESDLLALAAQLESLEDRRDRAIGGSWRSWGVFRATVHRVVAAQLNANTGPDSS